MSNTTYAHLKVDGKDWLVPEPVKLKPKRDGTLLRAYKEINSRYNHWLTEKTNWLEIHPDHVTEFEGRKGLVEGKDFEAVPISKTMPNGWYANNQVGEQQKNTDNKRSVAIPMTQTQTTEERAREILEHIVKIAVDQQAQLTDAYGTFSSFRFTKWIKERPELLEFARTGEKEVCPHCCECDLKCEAIAEGGHPCKATYRKEDCPNCSPDKTR